MSILKIVKYWITKQNRAKRLIHHFALKNNKIPSINSHLNQYQFWIKQEFFSRIHFYRTFLNFCSIIPIKNSILGHFVYVFCPFQFKFMFSCPTHNFFQAASVHNKFLKLTYLEHYRKRSLLIKNSFNLRFQLTLSMVSLIIQGFLHFFYLVSTLALFLVFHLLAFCFFKFLKYNKANAFLQWSISGFSHNCI